MEAHEFEGPVDLYHGLRFPLFPVRQNSVGLLVSYSIFPVVKPQLYDGIGEAAVDFHRLETRSALCLQRE